jgi:conjugal transfer pilus assembly protein TraW
VNLYIHKNINKSVEILIVLLTSALLFFGNSSLYAKDLGVIGKVYPIEETDLLEFIKIKIELMQKNGNWEKIQNEWKQRVADHIDRPVSVDSITKTTTAKTWSYDPSIIVPYDLKDADGNIFAKAGTSINPLSIRSLHTALVFYDGDDSDQVKWAKKINQKYMGKTKLILVRGSISQQEKIFHQPIYFDQQGKLTTHFIITHVPALVFQEGLHLQIMEVVI